MSATPIQEQGRQKRYDASMAGLVRDSRFSDFIDAVRQDRESAIRNLFDPAVLSNTAALGACVGEIAAYTSLMDRHDNVRALISQGESSED